MPSRFRLIVPIAWILFGGFCACKTPPWGRPKSDTIPPKLLAQFRWLHANGVLVHPHQPLALPDATKTWWEYTVDFQGNETIKRLN